MTKIDVAVFVFVVIACHCHCWRCINKISAYTKSFSLSLPTSLLLLIWCHSYSIEYYTIAAATAARCSSKNEYGTFIPAREARGKHTFTTWLQRNYEWKIMIIIVAALLLCEVRMFDPYPYHAMPCHTLTLDVIHFEVWKFSKLVCALSTIHTHANTMDSRW